MTLTVDWLSAKEAPSFARGSEVFSGAEDNGNKLSLLPPLAENQIVPATTADTVINAIGFMAWALY